VRPGRVLGLAGPHLRPTGRACTWSSVVQYGTHIILKTFSWLKVCSVVPQS